MRIAEGFARKVSLAFIGLSFIGWIVFTAGFGLYRKWLNDNEDFVSVKEYNLYAYWAGSVIGPFVHILAVAHVLLWGLPSSVVGSITAVLSIMYLSAVGFAMVYGGIYINSIFDGDVPDDLENGVNLVFAGGFITTLFLAVHIAFWPWFKKDGDDGRTTRDFSNF